MEMEYRTLDLADYRPLLDLWQQCDGLSLREADSKEGLARYLERNPGLSFVALHEDRICGSLMAGHDGRRGYIQHLAVAPDRRRCGIGKELLGRCLAALLDVGIVKSHVHVLKHNRTGIDFWTRLGYVERDEIAMFSYINGDNPDV